MSRPALEVSDIFRGHGSAWRQANAGHVSLEQLKVMSAIENCRTAELGGHVARCENEKCGHTQIAYNSCRNKDWVVYRPDLVNIYARAATYVDRTLRGEKPGDLPVQFP